MEKSAKIYIAGHRGMVGSAILRKLEKEGFDNIITRTSSELDLRNQADVRAFFEAERPEYIFLAAAKVQYEGIQMQSMSVKYGSGDRATVENFHVLKEYKPLNEYVRATETRWYDKKSRKLSSSVIKDKAQALPLHGSYKKYSGENLIEEGYYYMGVKDGRWVKYDTKYNLIDKAVWNRGFPAESRITYYDSAHTQVKEVMPVAFGEVEGEYLQFYKEGQLAVGGKYDSGKKIGRWVEYYQFRRQRKKEIQYPKTAWDDEFEPFILREWDDKGKLLYDYTKDPRASAEEEETEN